jgi:eukaryotic sulfide quinone oxidoreductase
MVRIFITLTGVSSKCSRRTLVGAGLRPKTAFRRALGSLIPSDRITHISENVKSFSPTSSSITTTSGRSLTYEALVLSAGLKIDWNAISGLPKALADPTSGVSSIYSYDTCDKVWNDIEALRMGQAIFTQPAGIIKCAGGTCILCLFHRWRTYLRIQHRRK